MSRDREAGFTLVEMLIAVALLGMLTVLAYGSIRFGAVAWQHSTERRQMAADREAVLRLFQRAVTEAYPAFRAAAYADRRVDFDGAPHELRLVAPLPQAIEAGVMARQRFFLHAEEKRQDLRLAWALDLPAPSGAALAEQATVLADGVSGLRLQYFGAAQDGDAPTWRDRWQNMKRLPELVRVRVWQNAVPDTPWIDLTVRTAVTTNTDCAYVADEPLCRRLQ